MIYNIVKNGLKRKKVLRRKKLVILSIQNILNPIKFLINLIYNICIDKFLPQICQLLQKN